jgi:hypothetical protein
VTDVLSLALEPAGSIGHDTLTLSGSDLTAAIGNVLSQLSRSPRRRSEEEA